MSVSVVTPWFALSAAYAWFDWATQFRDRDAFVGPSFFHDYARDAMASLRSGGRDGGLVPDFDALGCDEFDPLKVHELIRHFYRSSSTFDMRVVRNRWHPRLRPIATLVTAGARRLGQLNIPIDIVGPMTSEFQLLDIDGDGQSDFVCWVRHVQDERGRHRGHFYTGAFRPFLSVVDGRRGAYLACSFPLPAANLAAVLKFHNQPGGGFRASSLPLPPAAPRRRNAAAAGPYIGAREAGTYIVLPFRRSLCIFPALGLGEDFRFRADEDADGPLIRGQHRCFWLGMLAFRLDYVIRPKPRRGRKRDSTS